MGAVGFVRVVVVGFFADKFFHEVPLGFIFSAVGTHDCSFEAEPEADGYALDKGFGECVFEAVVVEFCEEAEGAEGEGEDRWDYVLEEPTGVENRSIASKLGEVSGVFRVQE